MDRLVVSEVLRTAAPPGARMSRCIALLLAALILTSCSGCQIVIGVLQIFQGFPKTKNDFAVKTQGRSLTEKDKRVVVVASATPGARAEEPSLDLDVMAGVSRRFKGEKITVVPSHKVARWIDDKGHIDWQTDIELIAKEFKADFVVLFTFEDFGYREENSPGLHRGHANGKVVVTEMVGDKASSSKKRAKVIYNMPFTAKYPANRPVSADQEGPDLFKRRFMDQLNDQLTRTFIDYRPEDEIQ
jgi:hypothetical protein